MLFIFYFLLSICCVFSCYFGCKYTDLFLNDQKAKHKSNMFKLYRSDKSDVC